MLSSIKSSHTAYKISSQNDSLPVTIRFNSPPTAKRIKELESVGVQFSHCEGRLLHSETIYPAKINPAILEEIRYQDDIQRIEGTFRPSITSTLNVSAQQVQATDVWNISNPVLGYDGSGVIFANVDTGIDIYHPGFFRPDAGEYSWIDVNKNNEFDNGIDAVDLNHNGTAESNETLAFFEPVFYNDSHNLIERTDGIFDAGIDWLYNDANNNGVRNYGPDNGYSENDPSFGELFFVIDDVNINSRLDSGEKLTGLGSSKILAIYDNNGVHRRGVNLFDSVGDTVNHGTGACGIAGGQLPGRLLTGMAPGIEIISINRINSAVEEAVLWAAYEGADIMMYEFASWVYEFLDGTSNLEQLINELYDEGIHQFTASGNLAGPARKKHATLITSYNEKGTLNFSVPDIGITEVYFSILWSQSFLNPNIILTLPDGSTIPLNGNEMLYQTNIATIVSGIDISPKQTVRLDCLLFSDLDFSGKFTISIINKRLNDLEIDAYITDNVTQWMNGVQFVNHITDDGTICSPGSAEKGITVGAYDPRGTRNEQGAINDFSSWGKTIDGRRAVDITAPGDLVYSLTSHDAIGGQPGSYMSFGGTSSALPHVAGCAALIVEAEHDITPSELKNIILSSAFEDNYTGNTPNDIWGYGKLHIFDAMHYGNLIQVDVNDSYDENPTQFTVSDPYPNPFNSIITVSFVPPYPDRTIDISIYNMTGQNIRHISLLPSVTGRSYFHWDGTTDKGTHAASGPYIINLNNNSIIQNRKCMLLR